MPLRRSTAERRKGWLRQLQEYNPAQKHVDRDEDPSECEELICSEKHRYSNNAAAQTAAQYWGLRSYRCRLCWGWHLTKKQQQEL